MIQNKFGEMIFNETDVCDLIMQGHTPDSLRGMLVDHTVDIERVVRYVELAVDTFNYTVLQETNLSILDYDLERQRRWHMPDRYRELDIAQHVLDLCKNDAELQRCGQELLLYQERDLFPLLQYLVYLVDVMQANRVIWGVGRGSSVASFVLYKLGVHRINSLYYDLSVDEFLR
jgi:Bacterial DNA polymerase III alpha NTPase domain